MVEKLEKALAVLVIDVETVFILSPPRTFKEDEKLFVGQVILSPRVDTIIRVYSKIEMGDGGRSFDDIYR